MLPARGGLEVLTTLRKRGLQTAVLILTARDTIDDRVQGLDSGADDYLVKPFAFPELLARIRALLRRGRPDPALRLQLDDLTMDVMTRRVTRAGRSLELTVKEFELLEYLIRHAGHVVSREMLARDVWHVTARATPLDNVIDVTVARLRRKIDDPFETKLLQTVRGVGFVVRGGQGWSGASGCACPCGMRACSPSWSAPSPRESSASCEPVSTQRSIGRSRTIWRPSRRSIGKRPGIWVSWPTGWASRTSR